MKSINSLLLSLAVLGMNMGSEAHPSGLSRNSSDAHVPAGTLVKRYGSHFSKTCKHIRLNEGIPRFLEAYCEGTDHALRYANIDLDGCLANRKGKLKWGSGYSHTCEWKSCKLVHPDFICQCKDGAGELKKSSYDLDEIIENANAKLTCQPSLSQAVLRKLGF